MIKGFRDFLMRGNVVDLAVAVVIGTAFTAVVSALVADIITPLIAAIAGKHDFGSLTFTINKSTFKYGAFINAVISFLLIAAAVYFLIVLPMNRMAEIRKARLAAQGHVEEEGEAPSDEVLLLTEIRDLLSAQQPR
ncbi:MAG TPA: large conductance mechanosensitive channel protein MscL [Jatrophihabitantaceae bacterium]|jgi:large conductance mechanosensitive channel|nr:large conductance mechanosensitive channel protein MscL [Jatrophihabitantaceae bacterium]